MKGPVVPELSIQDVEAWRDHPDILASGPARDGSHKQFKITPNGFVYIFVDRVMVATFTELQSAIVRYNEL